MTSGASASPLWPWPQFLHMWQVGTPLGEEGGVFPLWPSGRSILPEARLRDVGEGAVSQRVEDAARGGVGVIAWPASPLCKLSGRASGAGEEATASGSGCEHRLRSRCCPLGM